MVVSTGRHTSSPLPTTSTGACKLLREPQLFPTILRIKVCPSGHPGLQRPEPYVSGIPAARSPTLLAPASRPGLPQAPCSSLDLGGPGQRQGLSCSVPIAALLSPFLPCLGQTWSPDGPPHTGTLFSGPLALHGGYERCISDGVSCSPAERPVCVLWY